MKTPSKPTPRLPIPKKYPVHLPLHDPSQTYITPNEQIAITFEMDRGFHVWNIPQRCYQYTIASHSDHDIHHQDNVTCNDHIFVHYDDSGELLVFNLNTLPQPRIWDTRIRGGHLLGFRSPQELLIFDRQSLWSIKQDPFSKERFFKFRERIKDFAFSRSGLFAFTDDWTKALHIWDLHTLTLQHQVDLDFVPILMTFTEDGKTLGLLDTPHLAIFSSTSHTWTRQDIELGSVGDDHNLSCQFSPNGDIILLKQDDFPLHLYESLGEKKVYPISRESPMDKSYSSEIALSLSGRYLIGNKKESSLVTRVTLLDFGAPDLGRGELARICDTPFCLPRHSCGDFIFPSLNELIAKSYLRKLHIIIRHHFSYGFKDKRTPQNAE